MLGLKDILLYRQDEGGGAGAPGTGDTGESTDEPDPAAEPSTTDTTGSQGPPEAIPYARFKEVNDAYRPYKDLEDFGHSADSLRQLAEWEVEFQSNPVQSWLNVAAALEDLPDDVRAAVMAHITTDEEGETPNEGRQPAADNEVTPVGSNGQTPEASPNNEEPPEWAKPLIEDYRTRRNAEERETQEQGINTLLQAWAKADEADGITDPDPDDPIITDDDKLAYLNFVALGKTANTPEELLQQARGRALRFREKVLQSQVKQREPGAPRPVPRGPALAPSGPRESPRTLEEATRRAKAAIEAGTLPSADGSD